jgi:exodeoxyribonuclease VII large subunit
MENKAISLCELLTQVKLALKNSLPYSWWVMAEISEIKVNYSGHCYLELIEKNDATESVKAKVRATIWSSVYRMIQPYFETTTQIRLSAGIKILVKASAEFHEVYGFSLNILDIEPSYTIGELARQKLEIINRLKAEGVFDMNRSLTMPAVPARIAVISSKTAAGFGDFMDQLTNNPYGYRFYLKLFPAAMQGNDAELSVVQALEKVYRYEELFDVVVIIRGGGAQSDLNCFNSYWLNYNICQFPLPVLTGIGHEQDETIADLVACKRLKTPTAVAEYLISCFHQTEEDINERSISLYNMVTEKVRGEKERLSRAIMILKPAIKKSLASYSGNLRMTGMNLKATTGHLLVKESGVLHAKGVQFHTVIREFLGNQRHKVEMLEKRNNYLDPFLILKRGYSVTYFNGKVIKDASVVKTDDLIETKLAEGILKSKTI